MGLELGNPWDPSQPNPLCGSDCHFAGWPSRSVLLQQGNDTRSTNAAPPGNWFLDNHWRCRAKKKGMLSHLDFTVCTYIKHLFLLSFITLHLWNLNQNLNAVPGASTLYDLQVQTPADSYGGGFSLNPPCAEISTCFKGMPGIKMCNHKLLHMEGGCQGLDWDREHQAHQGCLCGHLPAAMI